MIQGASGGALPSRNGSQPCNEYIRARTNQTNREAALVFIRFLLNLAADSRSAWVSQPVISIETATAQSGHAISECQGELPRPAKAGESEALRPGRSCVAWQDHKRAQRRIVWSPAFGRSGHRCSPEPPKRSLKAE